MNDERIISAAIMQNGVIYTGNNHADIIHYMVVNGKVPKPITGDQGFYTSTGRFIDRKTAAKLAEANGQLIVPLSRNILFSQDIDMPIQDAKEVLDNR